MYGQDMDRMDDCQLDITLDYTGYIVKVSMSSYLLCGMYMMIVCHKYGKDMVAFIYVKILNKKDQYRDRHKSEAL